MQNEFLQHISAHSLCKKTDNLLLAVSGGMDSMCMLWLCKQAGFRMEVAHCNFRLRGEESDEDEAFIRRFCQTQEIPLYVERFNTVDYADENNISIQMAARELRYDWFEKLRQENNFDHIAIAHNRDDVIETFFINLTRGTGIRGLTGIKAKSGPVIRPLLFASRERINRFVLEQEIPYREDSSNKSKKYMRNKIRHDIVPAFRSLNPAFDETLIQDIAHIHETFKVYNGKINQLKHDMARNEQGNFHIDKQQLLALSEKTTVLYEFVHAYGFNTDQVKQIIAACQHQPGAAFYSETHKLIIDRDDLIVAPLQENNNELFYIDENHTQLSKPFSAHISRHEADQYQIKPNKHTGAFDAEKLSFPLMLRKWKAGDYFQPLGMQGIKKLSDFFVDNKFSRIAKDETWLLVSDNKIVWVIGHRIDERFKIKETTTNVLEIKVFNT